MTIVCEHLCQLAKMSEEFMEITGIYITTVIFLEKCQFSANKE
jgi:hypothetical protein